MEVVFFIAIGCFLLRAAPALLKISPESSDHFYHLFFSEYIRKNRFRCPGPVPEFLLPGIYDYPPFFHYLMAVFPKRLREIIAPYMGGVIDAVHTWIIYGFVLYLAAVPPFSSYLYDPIPCATVAAVLFATSPALLARSSGPRAYTLTTRPLGELLFTLYFFLLAIFLVEGDIVLLLCAAVVAAVLFLSSKFGLQVMVLFSLIAGVFLQNIPVLVLPLAGILLAIIISGGHFVNVIRGSLLHSVFYYQVLQKEHVTRTLGTVISDIRTIPCRFRYSTIREYTLAVGKILYNYPFFILITRNILFLIIFTTCLLRSSVIGSSPVMVFLFLWLCSSIAGFILTVKKPLLFLGEAERYLEYSISAQAVLFAVFFSSAPLIFFLLLGYHAFYYTATIFLLFRVNPRRDPSHHDKKDLVAWMRAKIAPGKKIQGIPGGGDLFEILYTTGLPVLYPPGNFTEFSKEEFAEIFERYPFPNRNLSFALAKYHIDILLVNKNSLKKAEKMDIRYALQDYRILFENPTYTVYGVS